MSVPTDQDNERKFQRAVALHGGAQLAEAQRLYGEIIGANPKHFPATFYLAAAYAQQGKYGPAAELFRKACKLNAGSYDAQFSCGLALQFSGRFSEAAECYERAIRLKPADLQAHYNRAGALAELKRFGEALTSYERALALKPDFVEAHFNRANALAELKRFEEALASYDRAIQLKADYSEAFSSRGVALFKIGRHEDALASYDCAILIKPDHPQAHCNRGLVLSALTRFEEAIESCDRAIALNPDFAEAHFVRAGNLSELKRFNEAVRSFDKAIELRPDDPDAWSSRGVALVELRRFAEALASFDRAIRIKPDFAEAHFNRGIALSFLSRPEEAFEADKRAIGLVPNYPEAYVSRGNALCDLKRLEEAIESYEKALRMKPGFDYLPGALLHTKMKVCDWTDYDIRNADLVEGICRGERAAVPFALLALTGSPAVQRKAAEIWINAKHETGRLPNEIPRRAPHQKLRVGYFSSDFYHHATAHLIAELLECHDRSKFELFAFSFGPETGDVTRERLKAAFDRFIDVRNSSDQDVASLARKLEIDCAVDLNGATDGGRPGVFALRAAPVQIGYLGFPGTLGADFIDYLLADYTLIPPLHRQYYAERIVYLPDSYQPNDRKRSIPDKLPGRAEVGLPASGFVFCSFNNSYKYTPDVFASWMRILDKVEGSVLWLLADNTAAARHLREEARAREIDPARLVFAPRVELPDHLARHRLADLFLDTLPCTAHTTASDALWAGLPLLTQIGETFAGRVAASLLNAIGLPELITTTRDEYEALAVELAANPMKLSAIKRKLGQNRLTAPLFDTERLARNIEKAFAAMHERYEAGLPPDHLHIGR